MIILVYSETHGGTVQSRLGKPEYSYHFVREKFLPVLRRICEVVEVTDGVEQIPALLDGRAAGPAVLFYFGPPHRAPATPDVPTVCVFAWEYATIPTETWDDNPFNDWRLPLSEFGNAITLSSYAADAVRAALGDSLHLAVIPAPIAAPRGRRARWVERLGRAAIRRRAPLEIAGRIYDSRDYRISHDFVEPLQSPTAAGRATWRGETLDWSFGADAGAPTLALVGFYNADEWGSWSRSSSPWITLPWRVASPCRVSLQLLGIGPNIDREIEVELGGDRQKIRLGRTLERFDLCLEPTSASDALRITGLLPTPGGVSATDPRTLGLGIASLRLEVPVADAAAPSTRVTESGSPEEPPQIVSRKLDGVVFTAVFNPEDGRKNWEDLVTAFCYSCREREDATLVLKMSHHNPATFYGKLMALWTTLHPFRCRIIALHGYLDERQYRMLVDASTYVVNSSRCEGQCLPLMEFMRQGVPAIAPSHTAMRDYIEPANAFVVEAWPAADCFPQDPRRAYRTRSYRIDWESLRDAFSRSYELAHSWSPEYRFKSVAAARRIAEGFGEDSVEAALRRFLDGIDSGE